MTEKKQPESTEKGNTSEQPAAFICDTCNKRYPRKEAADHQHTCCGRTMREIVAEGFGP